MADGGNTVDKVWYMDMQL